MRYFKSFIGTDLYALFSMENTIGTKTICGRLHVYWHQNSNYINHQADDYTLGLEDWIIEIKEEEFIQAKAELV